MTFSRRFVIAFFKVLTSLICRIEDGQLERVPDQGPLVIYTNHVNVLEIPVLFTRLQPRPATGFVAAVRWESTFFRFLLDTCGAIPLHRGQADVVAIRKGIERVNAGEILVIAPEGTRSSDGRLQKAHPGAVLLALHAGAPLQPVACYGYEDYKENLRKLRRTDFHFAVGEPFHLDVGGIRVTRQVRRQIIDEMMYRLAALLPPPYRGEYADLDVATQQYLVDQI